MRSIRGALILGTTIGTSVVLTGGGLFLYARVRASLVDQKDRSLADAARIYASTVEPRLKKGGVDVENLDLREFEQPERPGYLQLWLPDGQVAFRSQSLGEADLERIAGPIESPAYAWVKLPGGRTGRAVGMTFTPQMDEPKTKVSESKAAIFPPIRDVTIVLARDTSGLDETLAHLRKLLLSGGAGVIALCAGVLWLAIRRGLAPLNHLAGRISRLAEDDLRERIEIQGIPVELEPVKDRLNDFLERLEAALKRERTLSADVAHELRSPLAGLRSILEVALSRSRDSEQYREALAECLPINLQMQAMVETLLSMTRLESGQIELDLEPVDPAGVIEASLKTSQEAIQSRRLMVQWTPGRPARVVTDRALLVSVVRNLVENAVIHADEGGRVRIECTAAATGVGIRVSNTGSTLAQAEAEHVFDQFWRGDSSRSSDDCHCGLGLTLVKRIVTVLGGGVSVRSSVGGEFEIAISIPTRQQAPDFIPHPGEPGSAAARPPSPRARAPGMGRAGASTPGTGAPV